jgi:Phosphotransferase enzyme family
VSQGANADVPLPAGRMTAGIVRRGDRVLRPAGPWSPAVHEYLRHLESAGFEGSPRVLGVEGASEVLTYLDGDVAADPLWQPGRGHRLPAFARTERSLRGAARLLSGLHAASAGFRPRLTEYRYHPYPPRAGEIVSHGDLGPWNTVYRDGIPVGFIDWDGAQPVDPIVDLADAAWAFVPLAPPEQLREVGFDPVPEIGARLRVFLDAYGLAGRRAILPALQRSQLELAHVTYWPLTAAEAADKLELQAQRLRWLHGVLPELDRAL